MLERNTLFGSFKTTNSSEGDGGLLKVMIDQWEVERERARGFLHRQSEREKREKEREGGGRRSKIGREGDRGKNQGWR